MNNSIVQKGSSVVMGLGLVVWAAVIGIDRFGRSGSPPVDNAHMAEWVARLQDSDPEIRAEACRNVLALGDASISLLLPLVEGEDRLGKQEATGALLAMRSDAAVSAMIHLVKTGDPRLRRRVIETFGIIGPRARAAVPALQELVRSKQLDRIEKLGGFCFLPIALAKIQGAEAVPILIDMLDDPELRVEVAESLACIGSAARAALPALEAAACAEPHAINRHMILVKMEAIRLSGTWMMTSIERSGKVLTAREAGVPIQWVIHYDTWRKGQADGEKASGGLRVDPLERPKAMYYWEDGTNGGIPKNSFFIYEIDGDTLKICGVENSSDPGQRPTDFRTAQNPNHVISHWKRKRQIEG